MRRQSFHKEVSLVVQTECFNQYAAGLDAPEFQQQADFIRATRITESHREAREQLNWLMREHELNLPELTWAYKRSALRWDGETRRWRSQHRMLDLIWGWFFVAACAVMLSAAFASAIFKMPLGGAMLLTAIVATMVYGGMACLIVSISLMPQKTAARVDKAYLAASKQTGDSRE